MMKPLGKKKELETFGQKNIAMVKWWRVKIIATTALKVQVGQIGQNTKKKWTVSAQDQSYTLFRTCQ